MDFNILECQRFIAPCKVSSKRLIHNHELDFYVKGPRTLYTEDRTYDITDGSVTFRRPGQVWHSLGDFNCYTLTVDFSKSTPTDHYIRNQSYIMEPQYHHILIDSLPEVFVPRHSREIHAMLSNLINQPRGSDVAHLMVEEILFLLNADLRHKMYTEIKPAPAAADIAAQYINQNFQKDITLSELANLTHLDKSYLVRLFKKQYTVTPIEYLIEQRLNHARNLLANTDWSINEISDKCGYHTTSFFITQFKKHFHTTPTKYRIHQKG